MKKPILIFFLFLSAELFSQSWKEYIAKNALPAGKHLELDSSHYDSFKKYRLIMMGEMHGTLEPAKLIEQLAGLILRYEDSVSVGLEIPFTEMGFFPESPSISTLVFSPFFSKPNQDGRNGTSWFELIRYCMNEPRIHLFFFDNSPGSCFGDRDEWMHMSVLHQATSHPGEKLLTLSGNIHNQLVPFKIPDSDSAYYKPMGFYCTQDSLTFPPGSICSIAHHFRKGKMQNNWGKGLELKKMKNTKSDFSMYSAENYLLFYPELIEATPFNCILFTRKVHHSESMKLKN